MTEQYLLQLMLTKGIGDVAIKRMLTYLSSHVEQSLNEIVNDPELLSFILKCRIDIASTVSTNSEIARSLFQELKLNNIEMVIETDCKYPAQLKKVLGKNCPPILFVKGNINLLSTPSVGFCGSRKVSPKGIMITDQCAKQLVDRNITVVSGYAAGTDMAAHASAMRNGGNTIFVLSEGILEYTEKIAVKSLLSCDNHVFVSQFMPHAVWNVGSAMKRNLVIIGLSKAMILVESGKSGGTFAAGEETIKRQQPLFVIDFAKPEVSAEANPYFIEKGGKPIRGKNGIPVLEKVFDAVNKINDAPEQLFLNIVP